MPAYRKSIAQHQLSGAAAKNPQRFRDRQGGEAQPKAKVGKAPRHLTADEQKVWREIVSQAPEGVLGSCDALLIEVCVKMILRMRTQSASMKTSEFTSLINVLGKLGLTPSDRLRFNVPVAPIASEEDDEWADL